MDFELKFNPTICKDVMMLTAKDFEQFERFDVVLASPPCGCFSIMAVSHHWKDGTPVDEETLRSICLVKHTLNLIGGLNPKFWVLENPVGMLRKMPFMKIYHHRVITQCQYGERRMKPTDLWGRFPPSFAAKKCRNNSKCHDGASRGSHDFGTQSLKLAEERAKIPYGLSLAVCLACEEALKL